MSEMRLRPDGDFIDTAGWQDLYRLTEHWQQDVNFYRDELRFLADLVDKYFVLLVKGEYIERAQKMVLEIKTLIREKKILAAGIQKHLNQLVNLMENPFSQDGQEFRKAHDELENKLIAFTDRFRQLKKDMFELSETVMANDKLRHLLTS